MKKQPNVFANDPIHAPGSILPSQPEESENPDDPSQLEDKAFFLNNLLATKKKPNLKNVPIFDYIPEQEKKTLIEVIQFHDETIFMGTNNGVWVLFRRTREATIFENDPDRDTEGWTTLDPTRKEYTSESFGIPSGYVREYKLVNLIERKKLKTKKQHSDADYIEISNHDVLHIEIDKEKCIVVVLIQSKKKVPNPNEVLRFGTRKILAGYYDMKHGTVTNVSRIGLKKTEAKEVLKVHTFAIQKAVDDSSNPFNYKSQYMAILCAGKIHRARVKLARDKKEVHELVEFKKRIEFNADTTYCHYMEYAGEYICLVLRRQYCILDEVGNMLFVSGKSYSLQEHSVFMKWDPLLETKDKLFGALVNVIGADKNIVDVNWSTGKIYNMAYCEPFAVAAQGNVVEFYTPYFSHGSKILGKIYDFGGSSIVMLRADESRIIAASVDGVWEIVQPKDKMKQLKAIITTPTYGAKNLLLDNWEQKISHLFKKYYPEKEIADQKRQELLYYVGDKCLSKITEWMNGNPMENKDTQEMIEKSFAMATDNFMRANEINVEKIVPLFMDILKSDSIVSKQSSGKTTTGNTDITWWQDRKNYGMKQLVNYLMARKSELLTRQEFDPQAYEQLRLIDKHLAITYDNLMRSGSTDDEKLYYEELKQLLVSKSYLPEERDDDINIANKLLHNLMSVNQQREQLQKDRIGAMIGVIKKQRDLNAVIDMLSRIDMTIDEPFFMQQIENILMIVKNPKQVLAQPKFSSMRSMSFRVRSKSIMLEPGTIVREKLFLSSDEFMRMFQSTTIHDEPSHNFPLSVMDKMKDGSDGTMLIDVSDYKIKYVKQLTLGNVLETKSETVRTRYALKLCNLYLEYLWTVVPRVLLISETRLQAGEEPGLVGRLRKEFVELMSLPMMQELNDATHMKIITDCLLSLRNMNHKEPSMHLLEERITICKHFGHHREAIFIIYFLLEDVERAVAYCFEALAEREEMIYYYEGSTNPFNQWVKMCFCGIESNTTKDLYNSNNIPEKLWSHIPMFMQLIKMNKKVAQRGVRCRVSTRDDLLQEFVKTHKKTGVRLLNLYGRYIDVRWEEGGNTHHDQGKTIFDYLPDDIPMYKLSDFLTKIIREQQGQTRKSRFRQSNLESLQTSHRIQRTLLETRKKVISDKSRCTMCKEDILVGYNSSDLVIYPDLQLLHSRCIKDGNDTQYPLYVHPKTLVDHRFRPINVDEAMAIEKLERPDSYFAEPEVVTNFKKKKLIFG